MTTASVEYDARPGPLRDDVAAAVRRWLGVLEAEARRAREAGDLPPGRDPADVAFELHSLASGGSVAGRLTGDATALDRTRAAMRRAIGLGLDHAEPNVSGNRSRHRDGRLGTRPTRCLRRGSKRLSMRSRIPCA